MQKEQSNSNIGLLFFVSFFLNGKFSNTIRPCARLPCSKPYQGMYTYENSLSYSSSKLSPTLLTQTLALFSLTSGWKIIESRLILLKKQKKQRIMSYGLQNKCFYNSFAILLT